MGRPLTGDPDNVIKLWTRNGPCQIELLSGDITSLPMEESVDIVMVSAFPGDYSPMAGTLMGALKRNLGINIAQLANHIEVDLRYLFSCWLSKPIAQKSPFKKVLCFERNRQGLSVPAQIREMFRAFVPVFNNQDHTVITPLLATGHQHQSKGVVLSMMLEGAAEWINAGLPLRKLKICLYEGISKELQAIFNASKLKFLKRNEAMKEQIFLKKFDVYIIFNPKDKQFLSDIKNMLTYKMNGIKIYDSHPAISDNVWQNNIFQSMVASKRIISILSPAFMESEVCLEQYNMAICCNRLLSINVLTPFYVQTIDKLPSYMGLVQWIECRVRKEGETWNEKVKSACSIVVKDVQKADDMRLDTAITDSEDSNEKHTYDVFISYSHKNPTHAEKLLQSFSDVDRSIKVFYDRSALTTGSNWQNMIYESVGECKCLIALLSETYMSSIVCTEEYNLGLARYMTMDKDMMMIPVYIEDLKNVPDHVSFMKPINAVQKFDDTASQLSRSVIRFLKGDKVDYLRDYILQTPVDIEYLLSTQRCKEVREQYEPNKDDSITINRLKPVEIPAEKLAPDDNSETDIAISYTGDSIHLVGTFIHMLNGLYPNLNISTHSALDQSRFTALDTAKKIVVFVSRDFVKNEHHMQELHLAVNRQRSSKQHILYLIKTTVLDETPFFTRILPYNVVSTDGVWQEFQSTFPKKKTKSMKMSYAKEMILEHSRQFLCHYYEYFAMVKAVEDVLESILHEKSENGKQVPLLLNVGGVAITRGDSVKSDSKVTEEPKKSSNKDSKQTTEVLQDEKPKELNEKGTQGESPNELNDEGMHHDKPKELNEKETQGNKPKELNEKETKGNEPKELNEKETQVNKPKEFNEKETQGNEPKELNEKETQGNKPKEFNNKETQGDETKTLNKKKQPQENDTENANSAQTAVGESKHTDSDVANGTKNKKVSKNDHPADKGQVKQNEKKSSACTVL
ncbi:hypothetical protein ACF0H5_001993 [Mactra antiquata]